LELTNGIGDLLAPSNRLFLEEKILPGYLRKQRWFASKDQEIRSVRLSEPGLVFFGNDAILFSEVEVELPTRAETYQLPLGLKRSDKVVGPTVDNLKLADVTLAGQFYTIIDAFGLDTLATGLIEAMKSNAVLSVAKTHIRCLSLAGFEAALPGAPVHIKRLSAEQSNSSLVFDENIIMKLIRRVMHGVNPEVEMIRYLTKNDFKHTPPLLGEVQNVGADGSSYSMYVVQKFVVNQGDAWGYTLDLLAAQPSKLNAYRTFAAAIGKRLAELHEVLSRTTDEPAFSPLEVVAEDVEDWTTATKNQLKKAFDVLETYNGFSGDELPARNAIIARREEVFELVSKLAWSGAGSLKTRIHGDFHLGQILVSNSDAFIIDFEGEPSKPLEVRRAKSSPMRDVAGLLRSLDYAAGASQSADEGFVIEMSDVFLSAYQDVLDRAPRRWVLDQDQQLSLLDLFLLEKCAYEICYEMANRPSWLAIPFRGLVSIVSRLLHLPELQNA